MSLTNQTYMTIKDAASYVGLPLNYLRNQLKHGTGPSYIVPSTRTKFFLRDDLDNWVSTWHKTEINPITRKQGE